MTTKTLFTRALAIFPLVLGIALGGCGSSGDDGSGDDPTGSAGGSAFSTGPQTSSGVPFKGTFVKDSSDGIAARLVMTSSTATQLVFELHWQVVGQHANFGDNTNLKAQLFMVGDQDNAEFTSGSQCQLILEFNPAHNRVVVTTDAKKDCNDALQIGGVVDISGTYDLQQ